MPTSGNTERSGLIAGASMSRAASSKMVGSNSWSAAGGGLRAQDRIRLTAQLMLTRFARLPAALRAQLGSSEARLRHIDLASIIVPDTPMALRVSEHAHSLSETWLYNHCQRSYVWGALLAQAEQIKFDAELFFVASMLHDLGLSDSHLCQDSTCACFAVEGARAAHGLVRQLGWENERADRLAEAISLHLNVRVGLAHGAEAHLLHAGAAADVIGARLQQIGPAYVTQVLSLYPRLDFKSFIVDKLKQQASLRPESRIAFLLGLGFAGLIRRAPFES